MSFDEKMKERVKIVKATKRLCGLQTILYRQKRKNIKEIKKRKQNLSNTSKEDLFNEIWECNKTISDLSIQLFDGVVDESDSNPYSVVDEIFLKRKEHLNEESKEELLWELYLWKEYIIDLKTEIDGNGDDTYSDCSDDPEPFDEPPNTMDYSLFRDVRMKDGSVFTKDGVMVDHVRPLEEDDMKELHDRYVNKPKYTIESLFDSK